MKSPVPIDTNDKFESLIKSQLKHDVNVYVASNSEFLSQGTAVKDTLYTSQIVIGVEEEAPGDALKEVYQNFDASIVVTNSEVLLEIFSKYGYYKESLRSIILKGKDRAEQIKKLVDAFRLDPVSELGEIAVTCMED